MSQKFSSPLTTSESELKIEEEGEDVKQQQQCRKKYNVITEKTRKEIIQQLTEKSRNIKEVAQQYNLKLSTCKAILSVYLKEGRIGKKTTRDRKSKIVNTVIIATINPMYPLSSQIIPYVNISEVKNPAKEENNSDLVHEALNKANEHLRNALFASNQQVQGTHQMSSQVLTEETQTISEQQMNQIKQTFMECQIQLLGQILLNSRKNSMDTQNGGAAPSNFVSSNAISPNLSAISGNANTGSPLQHPLKNFLHSNNNGFNLANFNNINNSFTLGSNNNLSAHEILNDFSIEDPNTNTSTKRKYSENNKIYRKNSVIIPPKENISEGNN